MSILRVAAVIAGVLGGGTALYNAYNNVYNNDKESPTKVDRFERNIENNKDRGMRQDIQSALNSIHSVQREFVNMQYDRQASQSDRIASADKLIEERERLADKILREHGQEARDLFTNSCEEMYDSTKNIFQEVYENKLKGYEKGLGGNNTNIVIEYVEPHQDPQPPKPNNHSHVSKKGYKGHVLRNQ